MSDHSTTHTGHIVPISTYVLVFLALLVGTAAIYILGRNRMRTTAQGFSSASRQG